MMVNELRDKIISGLSPHLLELGLTSVSGEVFCSYSPDMALIVQITFLDSRHASYFGACEASFNLEFGGIYHSLSSLQKREDFPRVHYCQIRGALLRDYSQPAPRTELPDVEHERRDIWWVDKSGENLDEVIRHAAGMIQKELKSRLDKLRNYRYLCAYLMWRADKQDGLFGFGRRGSPARKHLLRAIAGRMPERSIWRWLISRYAGSRD